MLMERPKSGARAKLTTEDYVDGVLAGDRTVLARAITLIESSNPAHRQVADQVLQELLPYVGRAHRIGITGVPGVGKSTLIDQFATNITGLGHRVAVLAVDPSSSRHGGSILGDKTRMVRLVNNRSAYVRPSPTAGTLGGVARKTRETMALCEAAGYDIILVETVGVGQSETAVADMVDFFLVLALPGAGDELQGIKKGIIEIADMIAVNKADGENALRAEKAAGEYQAALHILAGRESVWTPPVLTVSGAHNTGLDAMWDAIRKHRKLLLDSGDFARRRQEQAVHWMHELLRERVLTDILSAPRVAEQLPALEAQVRDGSLTASRAVTRIFQVLEAGRQRAAAPSHH